MSIELNFFVESAKKREREGPNKFFREMRERKKLGVIFFLKVLINQKVIRINLELVPKVPFLEKVSFLEPYLSIFFSF